MMSLVQYVQMSWGFQLAWYMVYFSLALSLFLLDRPRLTWIALSIALVVATVGSYSSIQGLLIWPIGLLLMYQRNRSPRMSVIWLGCGVIVGIVYFYNLSLQQGASFYALRTPSSRRSSTFSSLATCSASACHQLRTLERTRSWRWEWSSSSSPAG